MKSIDHAQARNWVQDRLDGILSQVDIHRLESHLQSCPECRLYAAQIQGLDVALHRQLSAPRVQLPSRFNLWSVALRRPFH